MWWILVNLLTKLLFTLVPVHQASITWLRPCFCFHQGCFRNFLSYDQSRKNLRYIKILKLKSASFLLADLNIVLSYFSQNHLHNIKLVAHVGQQANHVKQPCCFRLKHMGKLSLATKFTRTSLKFTWNSSEFVLSLKITVSVYGFMQYLVKL